MASQYGYYLYDDSLTPGRSKDGGLSQLLFDSEGKLADHASFHPEEPADAEEVNDPEGPGRASETGSTADAQAVALLVLAVIGAAAGGYVAARRVAPYVQRMMDQRVFPNARKFWDKVRGQGRQAPSGQVDAGVTAAMPVPAAGNDADALGSAELVVARQMSAEEWYDRFRAMFMARQFAEKQWALLATAHVVDDPAIPGVQRGMASSTAEAVLRQAESMLDATRQAGESAVAGSPPIEVGHAGGHHVEAGDEGDGGARAGTVDHRGRGDGGGRTGEGIHP